MHYIIDCNVYTYDTYAVSYELIDIFTSFTKSGALLPVYLSGNAMYASYIPDKPIVITIFHFYYITIMMSDLAFSPGISRPL